MLKELRSLFKKNKYFIYAFTYIKGRLKLINKTPLIVHTPGHVGSSTVFNSLLASQKELKDYFLIDVHSLFQKWNNKNWEAASTSQRHVIQELLANYLPKHPEKPVKVICVMRDPVDRAIGGFFQSIQIFGPEVSLADINENTFENEFDHIKSKIYPGYWEGSYLSNTIHHQLNWFEDEIKPFFNIDVNHHLDRQTNGYALFKNKNKELLVLKLECLNNYFKDAIQDFIGINCTVQKANQHAARKNANVEFYKYFKRNFTLPEQVLERIYSFDAVKMFYSPEEIEMFKKRWCQQTNEL